MRKEMFTDKVCSSAFKNQLGSAIIENQFYK